MHGPEIQQLERSPTVQAWHLKERGWSQRRIAEALSVSEGAVSQWLSAPDREVQKLSAPVTRLVSEGG